MSEKTTFITNLGRVAKFLYIFFLMLIMLIFLGEVFLPNEGLNGANKVSYYPGNWVWVERNCDVLPGEQYDLARGELMTITSTLPATIQDHTNLVMRASQQTLYLYVDGEERACFDTAKSRIFGKNSQSAYFLCEFGPEDAGKEITITMVSRSKFTGLINDIYWCTAYDFWHMIIKEAFPEIVLTIVMFTLGICSMLFGAILRIRFKKKQLLEYLGAIIIFSAMLITSESPIRQLLFPNMSVIAESTYISIVFILVAIQLYVDTMQGRRYHVYYATLQIVTYCLIPINFFCVWQGFYEFYDSITLILVFVGITVIMIVITSSIDHMQKRMDDYHSLMEAIIILLFLTSAGHFFVNILNRVFNSIGLFIDVGLIVVLFVTVNKTIVELADISREQQRMQYEKETKDIFFATISHEIRTPINSVLGMNELILRENKSPDIQEYAQNIENSGRMLLSLVNDFLDFSKFQSGGLTLSEIRYSTKEMLFDTVRIISERMQAKGLEFVTEFSSELPSVLVGDDVRIKQVMINLLTNACKYTPSGRVTFTVKQAETNDAGFALYISVKDTGKGIKKENIGKLFDAYARVVDPSMRAIEGTGLGLAITKGLLDLMDGTITVESEVDKGSTFTVIIPQEIAVADPIGDAFIATQKSSTTTKRFITKAPDRKILIVDDNSVNLKVISGLLKNSEMEIDTATGGAEAIHMCAMKTYDLIFMDHMMPDIDGFEAMRQIRISANSINRKTPMIALTANVPADADAIYIKQGFTGYLAKPVDTAKLNILIKEMFPEAYLETIDIMKC